MLALKCKKKCLKKCSSTADSDLMQRIMLT